MWEKTGFYVIWTVAVSEHDWCEIVLLEKT